MQIPPLLAALAILCGGLSAGADAAARPRGRLAAGRTVDGSRTMVQRRPGSLRTGGLRPSSFWEASGRASHAESLDAAVQLEGYDFDPHGNTKGKRRGIVIATGERVILRPGQAGRRERMASLVADEFFGDRSPVPSTRMATFGGEVYAVQRWVEDGASVWWVPREADLEGVQAIATLDYLLANRDRHGKNLVQSGGRIFAIDFDWSFPGRMIRLLGSRFYFGRDLLEALPGARSAFTPGLARSIAAADLSRLSRRLADEGLLDARQRRQLLRRARKLQAGGLSHVRAELANLPRPTQVLQRL